MNYLANDLPLPQPYDELYRASRWNSDELKALATPAPKLQIAHCLALLLKSFPNAGAADAHVYGGMLVQDVAAAQPAIGDIEDVPTYSTHLKISADDCRGPRDARRRQRAPPIHRLQHRPVLRQQPPQERGERTTCSQISRTSSGRASTYRSRR